MVVDVFQKLGLADEHAFAIERIVHDIIQFLHGITRLLDVFHHVHVRLADDVRFQVGRVLDLLLLFGDGRSSCEHQLELSHYQLPIRIN